MVKEQLQMVDNFLEEAFSKFGDEFCFRGYFSSLAKTANYWRERVHDVISSWENIHGPHGPKDVNYRAYPLKIIGGRWGSVENGSAFLLARTRKFLQPVLMGVLSSAVKAQKVNAGSAVNAETGDAENEGHPPIETNSARGRGRGRKPRGGRGRGRGRGRSVVMREEEEDDRHAYHFRMSKWALGCYMAVRTSLFWLLLRMVNTVRQPLSHFFHWCEQNTQNRMIFQLVTGKAEDFLKEFQELKSSFQEWFGRAVEEAQAHDLPVELLDGLRSLGFRLLTSSAASFHLRVATMTTRQSGHGLWLCFNPCHTLTLSWRGHSLSTLLLLWTGSVHTSLL